jgi:hypothetical protein
MPYPQRGRLWLAAAGATSASVGPSSTTTVGPSSTTTAGPSVTIRWDGIIIATPTLTPGWQAIDLDLSTCNVGEHELSFETPAAGISVGNLELRFAPDNHARYGD